MIKLKRLRLILSATFLVGCPVFAQQPTATALSENNEVFATQGEAVLTQEELDAAFMGIPREHRLLFIRDGDKVETLVKSLLRNKLIAADARESGFDQDPVVKRRLQLAAEKELAEAWVVDLLDKTPEADYEALAREHYLANPDDYMTPEAIDVSHILIQSESRPEEDALEIAQQLRNGLREDPGRFDEFVTEFSDDPAKSSNGGRYPRMQRGQMVKPFEQAAFALAEAGDISEPVKTAYGYHIIRLNRVLPPELVPFDQIREPLMQQAKEQYLSEVRLRYIKEQVAEPIDIADGAVEAMVKRYFGDDLENAPELPE